MGRSLRWQHVAAVAAVVSAAGCGSTVQVGRTAAGAGQVGGDSSLSVAPGATPGVGAGTTAPGAAAAPGVAVPGGASATGANAPAAAGGAQPGTGGSGTGTASGGTLSVSGGGANGPGVTPTTISLGDAYSSEVATADSAAGVANANPGDTKAETEAVIGYINQHGGAARRKLNIVWYQEHLSDSASTMDQGMCSKWTQDNHVLVMPTAGEAVLDQCLTNARALGLNSGSIVMATTAVHQRFPADIDLTGLSIDHSMTATVNGVSRQSYFSNGAKVGIVTWDADYYRYGVEHAALPALARLGVRNVAVQYVAVPQTYGDISSTSSSAGNAVLQFRTKGIDHVLLFDGPAGVTSSAILFVEWMNQANSQRYYPRYGLNSTSGFNALAGDVPQKELENSVGVGWMPSLEETSTDFANTPMQGDGKLCLQIMRAAGQQQSGANAIAVQLGICDRYFFLKRVLDSISGPINQQTVLAAIDAVHTGFVPSLTFGVDLHSGKHDGATAVRNMGWFDSCTCYRYTSAAYSPF